MSIHSKRHFARFQAPLDPSTLPVYREPADPMTLPVLQQAALLSMHESAVRRAVVAKLLAEDDCQDKPSFHDYRALVGLGFCGLSAGKRYHELTVEGLFAARKLEKKLCSRFSIHLLLENSHRASGPTVTFHCCCGWMTVNIRNSHTAPGNARAQFRTHLRTVKGINGLAGALQPMTAEGI